MTLPEKFKFKMNTSKYFSDDNIEYTAELNDGVYDISYYSPKGIYNNFSYRIVYTQKSVEKGNWIIIEEELPVEFKFTVVNKCLYTASLDTGDEYLIQWIDTYRGL